MTIPGPDNITRAVMPNGAVVLIYENNASDAVVVRGSLRAGALHETAAQSGLAVFTAEMVERGTTHRTFQQIAEQTERAGASVGFGAGLHTVGFHAKGLSEDLRLLLDILGDIMRHPTFPRAEMERVRGELVTSIREREDSTDAQATLAFRRLAYGAHPYGRDTLGTLHSVRGIRRADLLRFYRAFYTPRGMQIAIVGGVRKEQALRLAAQSLGTWNAPAIPSPDAPTVAPARPLPAVRRKHVKMHTKMQSDLVLGAPALARTHPDFLAAELADVVLGEFGMMGRLGDIVRDQLGLAYSARSSLESAPGPGAWVAHAAVNPQNVETAIAAILDEMNRLKREPVADSELDDVKDYMTGLQPIRLESNDGIASALLDMEFYALGLDYLQRLPALVRAVTPAQVQAAAQKYLNTETYALAIAGP